MRYLLCIEVVISMSTEVEASSLAGAIAEAKRRGTQGLCHHCAEGRPRREWVTSGEFDCDPASSSLASILVDDVWVDDRSMSAARALWDEVEE